MKSIQFPIHHRFSGEVVFTATIECAEDAPFSLKMGLAAKAAIAASADLSEANLSKANLSKADLSEADLRYIKHDIWGILLHALPEVPALRLALLEGRVDGSVYSGECACLCGTIANVRGCGFTQLAGIQPNVDSLAERFFLAIRPGDTPDESQPAALVVQWIDELTALLKPVNDNTAATADAA